MKSFGLTASEFAERTTCAPVPKDLDPGLAPGPVAQRIQGFPFEDRRIRKTNYADDKYFLTTSTRQLSADVYEPIQWLR